MLIVSADATEGACDILSMSRGEGIACRFLDSRSNRLKARIDYPGTGNFANDLQAVELEGDYNFSDNYFTMLEGEVKTVTFEKFSDKANGVTVKSYALK